MKVGDMIGVADFHDLCRRLCRKVGVMELGVYRSLHTRRSN